jgi:hypothetical protein
MSGGRDLVFTILGIDKGSPAFDKVGNSAERMGHRIDKAGNLAIKSMLGIEAVGVASGLAVAGALGSVPLLFAGVATAALKSNQDVQTSFKNLSSNVRDDVKAMTEPLVDDFVGVANDLGTAWGRDVAPVMKSIFADPAMGRGIRELSKGVGEFAAEAMPGFLTAVQASPPVMEGFRSVLKDTGTGVNEFFTNVSASSESAGQIVTGFGRITSDALGDVGDLVAQLSDSVAPHMGEIERLFDQSTDSVLGLATNALPILTSASGATMGVLNSVLGVLEPISGTLGTGLGLTLAAAGGWRVLTGAGNAFTKLDLGGRLERTALSAGVMTESFTGSAAAGERVATSGSKLAGVLRGVGSAIPFVGAAAVGLTVAIDALEKPMDDAADRGQALAEALLKGGSEADKARERLAALNEENRRLNDLMTDLQSQQRKAGDEGRSFTVQMGALGREMATNNKEIDDAKTKYQEMRDKLTGAALKQVEYNEAVAAHGTDSAEAASAGAAWRAALDQEAQASRNASDAVKTHTDRLTEQQNIKLGIIGAEINHQNALLGVEQAQKNMTDTLALHTAASFEGRTAILGYESALLQAVQAASAKSRAENAMKSEAEQARLATQAEAVAILDLAAAAGDTAPPKLQQMVAGLNASTLAALGVTARVNEAGQAVYRLPDGREIVINAQTEEAKRKIDEINAKQVFDKSFYVTQINAISGPRLSDPNAYSPGIARGDEVRAGRSHKVGEEGVETFVPTTPGVIIPHSATVALQRAGRLGEGASGSTKIYQLTVQNAGNTNVDIRAQFERMELLDMPV